MDFVGLPLSTLFGVGAAAATLTVLLYVLKLRRRPVAVPFSRLWDSILRDRESSQLFSKLRRLLSLLLQLCLLGLLLFALGQPEPSAHATSGRHMILLIDASASMKATDVSPNRLSVAKSEAKKLIQGLGPSDRMLIVEMGAVPTPLSNMSSDAAELEPALERVRAVDTRADLGRALEFAADALRGLSNPELILISDGALGVREELPRELEHAALRYVPVGKSGKNLAITEFSVRRYPLDKSRHEALLEVTNTNDQQVDAELSIYADGEVIETEKLRLGPNERLPRVYPSLGGGGRKLEARVRYADGSRDDLPADDRAFALLPERRRVRVLLVTAGNTYLEAALLLDEYLDLAMIAPGAYPPRDAYEVTIFDGVAPAPAKHTGSLLYLDPPAAGSPVKLGKALEDFGFDTWDKKHPILHFTALGDIQVASGHAFVPQEGDQILGASDQGPILVSGMRQGTRFVALGFDPRRSDFVLRVAWPLFVLGTIQNFVEEDTSYISSYRTGEVWRIPTPSAVDSARLLDPSGAQHIVPVKDGRAAHFGSEAGIYRLITGNGAGEAAVEFAANLSDVEESKIAPQAILQIAGHKASAPSGFASGPRREFWVLLLLAAIALSMAEWFLYHRRITV
ncbi:MAG TPA: VWA domain-containing protein [Polyangiaceae bacterium]|nr:VWA domain-containing protein [Polyangiaceae bacterium]